MLGLKKQDNSPKQESVLKTTHPPKDVIPTIGLNIINLVANNAERRIEEINEELQSIEAKKIQLLVERDKLYRMSLIANE